LQKWGWRKDKGGYERGKDYNHSAFCDLVIRGICGLNIGEHEKIELNPLIPENSLNYFYISNLPYKNREIDIVYDATGERYNKGKGLIVVPG
jgi:hypothetical protein